MINSRKSIFLIISTFILALSIGYVDLSHYLFMFITFNHFHIYIILMFLVLCQTFNDFYSKYVIIRIGKRKYYQRKIKDFIFSLLLFFLYFTMMLFSNYNEVNLGYFLLVIFQISFIYLTSFNLSIFLLHKGFSWFFSLFIGLFMLLFLIYYSSGTTNIVTIFFISITFCTLSFILLIKNRMI